MMLINICIFLILSVSIQPKNNKPFKKVDMNPFITFAGARFDVKENGESTNRYIWLHGDEQTARMALEHHIKKYQGIAFFIASKTREVPFKKLIQIGYFLERAHIMLLESLSQIGDQQF